MEGVYRMNKFIIFLCIVFLAVLMVSCGRNEKEIQKDVDVFYSKMIESFDNWRPEEVILYADRQLELCKYIKSGPLKTYTLVVANVYKGQAKLMQNKTGEAIGCFELAFHALHPVTPQEIFRKADLAINLAGLYHRTGNLAAYKKYSKILSQLTADFEKFKKEERPEKISIAFHAMVYLFKVEMNTREKNYAEALSYSRKIMDLYGGEAEFEKEKTGPCIEFQCFGIIYYHLNQYKKAEHYLLKSYERYRPKKCFFWDTMETLADLYLKTKEYEKGIAFCQRCLQDVRSYETHQRESKIKMLLLKQAEMYHKCGKQKEVEILCKEIMNLNPTPETVGMLEKMKTQR